MLNQKQANISMQQGAWGMSAHIDLSSCEHSRLNDPELLKKFFKQICEEISMIPHGSPIIERFGDADLEGWSGVQLIETSNINVHCDEFGDRCFIDLFTCKVFDPQKALSFCKEFFRAKKATMQVMERQ